MSLFKFGDFTLSSGIKSKFKIDCDCLDQSDIETLAFLIKNMVGSFTSVEGVPRGGLRLAKVLEGFVDPSKQSRYSNRGRHLIVDDVFTTGRSIEWIRENCEYTKNGWEASIRGAVIFSRGELPAWVSSLFQMPYDFWPSNINRAG